MTSCTKRLAIPMEDDPGSGPPRYNSDTISAYFSRFVKRSDPEFATDINIQERVDAQSIIKLGMWPDLGEKSKKEIP